MKQKNKSRKFINRARSSIAGRFISMKKAVSDKAHSVVEKVMAWIR